MHEDFLYLLLLPKLFFLSLLFFHYIIYILKLHLFTLQYLHNPHKGLLIMYTFLVLTFIVLFSFLFLYNLCMLNLLRFHLPFPHILSKFYLCLLQFLRFCLDKFLLRYIWLHVIQIFLFLVLDFFHPFLLQTFMRICLLHPYHLLLIDLLLHVDHRYLFFLCR